MKVKFQKNNMNKFILGVLNQVFCTGGQKSINQLLRTAPDCPILSATGKPTHKFAKCIVPISSPLTVDEISVHDSLSFADEVSRFCPDHFMAILDVESLFTNIPLNEVIDICIDDLFCDTCMIHNLDCNDTRELLTLAANELFFINDKVMYR